MSYQILPNLISQIFQLIPPLHPFVSILALITYHPPPPPIVPHLAFTPPIPNSSPWPRLSQDWTMSLSYPNPVGDFRLSTGRGPNFLAHSWPQQLCQPLIFTAATGHASLPSSGHLHMQDPAQGMPSVFSSPAEATHSFRSQGHRPLPPKPGQSVPLLQASLPSVSLIKPKGSISGHNALFAGQLQ